MSLITLLRRCVNSSSHTHQPRSRPCGHCRKKGRTAEQCVDGCEACRQARARCEGGTPCMRCKSMHLNCVEGTTLPLTTLHSRGEAGGQTQLACKSCHRGNKKCEDQRPCRRCVQHGYECIPVVRRPKRVKVRCQSCREGHRRCEDARPCYYCSTSGEVCIDLPRKGRGHGMRVKAACVKCREHKVRCDGRRPCASCDRKGLVCQDKAGSSSRKHHASSLAGATISPSRSSLDVDPTCIPPDLEFHL